MMTIPRELRLVGDRIAQYPLSELEDLRTESFEIEASQQLTSGAFELELSADDQFSFELCNDSGDKVTFSGSSEEFCLDRSQSTYLYAEQFGQVRFAKRGLKKQNIRAFVDNSSLEVFCDNGETVFTSRIFIQDMNRLVVTGAEGTLHYLKANQFTK
ncbi:sucrose-6-phosphate hydrolase [Vibrio ishigakensis]|uniref:Sucrose-6-phosphate hydrolase n=1 Tax=Vibrio ishigakensis TaxID=1481914 RepID=A0A0B8P186_9VIBR|nr:sucrose-6-phosphate hydrolase [Vibrio ishigakensis]